MERTTSYYDLRDALAEPGCPICRLKTKVAARYLDTLLYESVTDPAIRAIVRDAHGFCHEHAWRLVRPGAALGSAILMHDVLRHLLRTLAGARFEPLPTLSLRRAQESLNRDQESATTAEVVAALTPETPCPACAQADEMEGIHLRTLVEHMVGADSLSPAFLESDGLCLPHFRQALGRVRRPAAFESLLSAQRTIWGHLEGQLAEAIRKSDTRFRHEPAGDEAGAWLRGIAAVSGPRETDDS